MHAINLVKEKKEVRNRKEKKGCGDFKNLLGLSQIKSK